MCFLNVILFISFLVSCPAEFSDEMHVYEEQCLGEGRSHCSDGSCVWQHQYCDGKVDCPDGSDENLCMDHTPEPDLCTDSHYLCRDGSKCIPTTWLCNNQSDCLDGSDEVNCTTPLSQPGSNSSCKGFECGGDKRCISSLWACDGSYDCADHSDEHPDTCRHSVLHKSSWEHCPTTGFNVLTKTKMYQCLDGSLCLEGQYMCNGMQDCKDGSDEGSFCQNWSTMCANTTCAINSSCYAERDGPQCVCHDNYHRYNSVTRTCEPVNMCAEPRPYCSQICEDKRGPFTCRCEEGYLVDSIGVGYVCLAPDPEAKLFFSTRNEIKYLSLKSRKIVTVATGIKQAHGVAFDGTYVYWVETAQGHQAIMAVPLDGTSDVKQVLVGLGLEDPGDISIDWVGGNFYFSDAQRGSISACGVSGKVCTTIKTDARIPKHLTLDVRNGKMYWADWHSKPVIMSARMDGSDPTVLVGDLQSFPAGLAVDSPSGRLYYVDNTLKGVRLDDGRVFSVSERVHALHHPYAVSVFENTVYWSDWASNTIQSSDKLTGQSVGAVATLDSPVYALHTYHPILSRPGQQTSSNCSHLRLLTSNQSSVCACPLHTQPHPTATTCQPIPNSRPEYLIVGAGLTFTLVQYNDLGSHGSSTVFLDIARVQAMAYDTFRDTLYIYDSKWKSINSIKMSKFEKGVTDNLIYMGLDNVVDMDYDYVTDSLYFADAGRKFIEVIALKTNKRAVIHRFEQEVPISLCVLPLYGKMLVAVSDSEQNEHIHIDSFGLDGSGRQHLLMNNLKGPHIKLRYSHKMDNVYLADEGNSIIDYMHPLGTGRENFRELSTSVTQLSLTDSLVVWTTRRGNRLYWADIHDTSRNIRRAELTMFPNSTHLHIEATWTPSSIPAHPCHNDPCSDICVQTPVETHFTTTYIKYPLAASSMYTADHKPSGFKCLCPSGLLLLDGKCTEMVTCADEEAYCHRSNVCVMKSQLCDGKNDCQHGEDEEGCTYIPAANALCSTDEKFCEGVCINKNTVCGATTTTSLPVITSSIALDYCSPSQFSCGEGVCVQRSQMCDGVPDCPHGSDEARPLCDTLTCLHTEFMCSSGHCILSTFRCDGETDCSDGSDEFNCVNKTCTHSHFQCRNLECIEVTKRCDAQQDCSDFSDEENCMYSDIFDTPEPENCAEWEYTCELNRTICLPLTARCNGKPDCPGNTDEASCGDGCPNGGLRCRQEVLCVPHVRICDGHKDCVAGDDETREACDGANKTSTVKPVLLYPIEECHEGYRCDNGQCIEWRNVCDQRPDCADGSDEGGRCLSACEHHTCSFTCQRTPLGRQCQCGAGYSLGADQVTCADQDECQQEVCSQHCYNTQGSFVCSCHRGYALRSDRRSCKAIRGNMSVLYVSGNSVRSITADGQIASEYNDDNVASITGMDVDVRRRKLYVTSAENGMLIEVNGTHDKVAVTNVGRPTKVAVDWISGSAYFVDSSEVPRLRVCNVRRRRCALLQKLPLRSQVTALVIDPASRKIFYCVTRDRESVIWSSSLSGRHVTVVAQVDNCTGLAVDSFKKRLYVAETGPAHIVTVDYDGNLIKEVVTDHPHLQAPHDLAIFEDHIYFLVANSFKLSRCSLFGKKHCEMYLQRVFNANSFVIRHESTQRDDIPDYCDGTPCDNVCVQGDLEAICLCDDGAVSKDGKCPLISKNDLPLFNGWTFRDYQQAHEISVTLIVSLCILFLLYISAFLYYQLVYKKKREQMLDYIPVHFQNSMAEGMTEDFNGFSPATTPTVQMPPLGAGNHEFVNPLQFFKNLKPNFRKSSRPIGTAGLEIDVPSLDVSDTESDLDDRENKKTVKK